MTNKIIIKEKLAENIFRFVIEAPQIAKKSNPGQFVILRVNETGERIPLTIADTDKEKGYIYLISMVIGKTTMLLSELNEGDFIKDILGPLGKKSEIEKFGNVICVGGGVGIAPLLPITRALKNANNHVISIIGAKNKDLLILEKEMSMASNEIYICTDDGSKGYKGFVSGKLQEVILEKTLKNEGFKINRVIAIGPSVMMKAVCDATAKFNIKTIVSLNSIMIDGTGMCGTCRVEVGKETKFACVNGPEFDGSLVNFDLLISRQKYFNDEENTAVKEFLKEHHDGKCKLELR
ncbi:MAG: sulfide/dihydroorotate dehydrogenase-like FAD/NAD-binding protein [Cyanobacteria bacterium]|nr:sulfide/dihydroorotate dehydrogenase-like FAD/NAD-binding protein [Cyanobacteriota bacterium]